MKYLYEFLTVYFCVDNYNKKYIQKMIKDWRIACFTVIYNDELR
jgi:hypothetical protein